MTYSQRVAKALLDINAVTLSPEKPFTWASGMKAPIYTDNRCLLYTSDAADEGLGVDLGGRRIIKKKKKKFFFFFFFIFFFFFKQKTAYEMLRSLVGSEMCIRDS